LFFGPHGVQAICVGIAHCTVAIPIAAEHKQAVATIGNRAVTGGELKVDNPAESKLQD
jgi:hypothetical protein